MKSELDELSMMFLLAAFKTGTDGTSFTGSAGIKDKTSKLYVQFILNTVSDILSLSNHLNFTLYFPHT